MPKNPNFRNINAFWILLTGMAVVLLYFLPVFGEVHLQPWEDAFGNFILIREDETYSGYEALVDDMFQPFHVWFIAGVLVSALLLMGSAAMTLSTDNRMMAANKVLLAFQAALSFFLLYSFSWIGFLLEALILADVGQALFIDRKTDPSAKSRVLNLLIILFLVVMIPVATMISFLFLPMF